MDTPRFEESQTRASTPVSELDDHRFQLSPLPGPDRHGSLNARPATRRGTQRSTAGDEALFARPDLSRVNEVLEQEGGLSRNFEQAILDDDDKSSDESIRDIILHGGRHRRPSISPTLAMKGSSGWVPQEQPKARSASVSSGSLSPPNSVDAFADPLRRGRSNTLESRGAEHELNHNRTISGAAFSHRPTFSSNKPNDVNGQEEDHSKYETVEEDVERYVIDFEALEEFAAENARLKGPVAAHLRRKHSMSSQAFKAKTARDLRLKKESAAITPASTVRGISPARNESVVKIDEGGIGLDEKCGEVLTPSDSVDHPFGDPNRYSFFSSELETTVHASQIGDLVIPGETFQDLFELSPRGGVWWLDVLDPTKEEIEALRKAFSIHPLTCEDILTHEAREKVELFPQYYFVCFRTFVQDKDKENFLDPINVYMIVFRQGILSFTFARNPHAARTRKRIGKERDSGALSADWICYAMLDDMVDSFQPAIKDIEKETDMIEDQVFTSHFDDFTILLRQIGECRKKVMTLMRLLSGKADVIKGFAKRCNAKFSVTPREEVAFFLGDVQDHVITMKSNLSHAEQMLSRSHANYLAQLSVNSIAQGSKANEVLAKITVIATILVPLNLICGLFGMNVPVPGRDSGNLAWFFGISGLIVTIIVGALCLARRYKFT